jgi:hypothetical protein
MFSTDILGPAGCNDRLVHQKSLHVAAAAQLIVVATAHGMLDMSAIISCCCC